MGPPHGGMYWGSPKELTRGQLRGSAWRRLHRGAYVAAALEPTHGLHCEGAQRVIPAQAAIGCRSAAWLHGVHILRASDPVEVIVPRAYRFGPVKGLEIRQTDLEPGDVEAGPIRATNPARTAWDLARLLPPTDSVPYLDAMVAKRLVSIPEVRQRLLDSKIRWGCVRAATALDLIDPRAESPQESRLRAGLVLAGLPRPETQYSVYAGYRFAGRVDLAWPDRRVAVEYDGLWHADAAQLHRDRRRLNQLVDARWTVLHVTSVRMEHEFDAVVREVRAALGRT